MVRSAMMHCSSHIQEWCWDHKHISNWHKESNRDQRTLSHHFFDNTIYMYVYLHMCFYNKTSIVDLMCMLQTTLING